MRDRRPAAQEIGLQYRIVERLYLIELLFLDIQCGPPIMLLGREHFDILSQTAVVKLILLNFFGTDKYEATILFKLVKILLPRVYLELIGSLG